MKAVIIKMACKPDTEGETEVPGWIVPDTQDVFAVDLRYEGDIEYMYENGWCITHLPTGLALRAGAYTEAHRRADACDIAKRFYDEMIARGANVHSSTPADFTSVVNNLPKNERTAFWEKIAGWKKVETGQQQSESHE